MRHLGSLLFTFSVTATLLASFQIIAAPPERSQPSIQIQSGAIVGSGFTAGNRAVVFGVVQEPNDYWWTLRRLAEIVSVGQDGTIRFESSVVGLDRAFWAVVDLKTGAVGVTSPTGTTLRQRNARPQSFHAAPGGAIDGFISSRESVEVLCVRPNVGAWALSNADGGANDRDRIVNGTSTTITDSLQPLGDSPSAPPHLTPHDVIIAVDPESMTFVSTEIEP